MKIEEVKKTIAQKTLVTYDNTDYTVTACILTFLSKNSPIFYKWEMNMRARNQLYNFGTIGVGTTLRAWVNLVGCYY